jgi:hypothetical protein
MELSDVKESIEIFQKQIRTSNVEILNGTEMAVNT